MSALFGLTATSPARADLLNFTYSGDGVSGSGQFLTGPLGSPYQILGITGTANGDTITGLSGYAGADNWLYFPTQPYVDYSGILLSTASSGDWGLGWTGSITAS